MPSTAKLELVPRLPRSERFTPDQVWYVIQTFLRTGESRHSAKAQTLQFVIDYCEENKIAYQLTAWPGQGYVVTKSTHGRR